MSAPNTPGFGGEMHPWQLLRHKLKIGARFLMRLKYTNCSLLPCNHSANDIVGLYIVWDIEMRHNKPKIIIFGAYTHEL